MRTAIIFALTVVAAILFGNQDRSQAQQPPAAPHTLWQFLGIPQAVHRSYDGLVNHKGGHPGLERKPPLKALADPANLQSSNPAIKAAAEIKQQEDLKPQKVKAIKYLAEIACGCYPGVKEALLAALDDCTEDVRYEAAVAFCKAAGNPCSLCNRATCCDAKVKDKLKDMAQGTDANGCCKEPSARVRAAAAMALNACNQIPAVAPAEKKEGPTPADRKEGSQRGLQAPLPPGPAPTTQSTTPSLISPVSLTTDVFDRPVSPEPLVEGGAVSNLDSVSVQHSGIRGIACRCPRCLGRGVRPVYPAVPAAPGTQTPAPSPAEERAEAAPGAAAAPAPTALAGTFGAARAPASVAPNMIGDTSAGGCGAIVFGGDVGATLAHPTFACSRVNIAENNSAEVQDRVYFNYRHFENASKVAVFDYSLLGGASMLDIDRYTLGFEKTLGECTSIEVRVPLLYQMSSNLSFSQINPGPDPLTSNPDLQLDQRSGQLGNISAILKRVLVETPTLTLSAGLGVNTPTASDVAVDVNIDDRRYQIFDPDHPRDPAYVLGTYDLLMNAHGVVRNQTVNLQPFVATLWRPTECFFSHGFLQIDAPLNSSTASIESHFVAKELDGTLVNDTPVNDSGSVSEQTLLRLNLGVGRWLYRDPNARHLNGIAAMFEVHYTTTLNDAAVLGGDPNNPIVLGEIMENEINLQVGNLRNRVDVTNFVVGVPMFLGKTLVTNAFSFPASTSWDHRGFDAEYSLLVERHF